MNVLLILPAGENYRVHSNRDKVPNRKMLRFSVLPLLNVASLTPEKYSVDIIDENIEPIDYDTDADVIGISFMTAIAPRAFELAGIFRAKGKIVIAGGYYPTLCPNECLGYFDATVVGDAEGIWPQVLEDVENNCLKSKYCHLPHQQVVQEKIPCRDLIFENRKQYATINAVQIGRGCKHDCLYCSITAFYKGKYTFRPIPHIIQELEGIGRNLIFVDDNIISDQAYAKALFKAMVPLKKRWVSQCSLQIADDPELLSLAVESGCFGLFVGVESLSKENLESVGKNINTEKLMADRIRIIRGAKIGIIAGLIVGMDNDTVHVFEDMMCFLEQTKIDAIQVNIMTPLPGTPLHAEFVKNKRIIDHRLGKYDFRNVVFQPKRMTVKELQAGADWLYAQFYRPKNIRKRAFQNIFHFGFFRTWVLWKLNKTYRYDNVREGIVGFNPACYNAKGE
jgi:radical SAM superfamily enzyme YgiQ (UPF0313 family)